MQKLQIFHHRDQLILYQLKILKNVIIINLRNEYYKLKQYQDAINKYTTALRYNPNNHLVYNNRALCYFILNNYSDAAKDALSSIQANPSFYKAWHRYGTILEKLANYRFAGICYKTAYMLSINVSQSQQQKTQKTRNQYQIHYHKYIQNLKKSGQNKIIQWINNFEKNGVKKTFQDWYNEGVAKLHNPDMMESVERQEKVMRELSQNEEYLNSQKEQELFCLMSESKYKSFIRGGNANNNLNETDGIWTMCWSSSPQIVNNKRDFCILIGSSIGAEPIIALHAHYGVPSAKDMLQYLYRTMAFSNRTMEIGNKPRMVFIEYRSRFAFDEMQKELSKLGISCLQETYQEAWDVCSENGTDINGWNHLDWAE